MSAAQPKKPVGGAFGVFAAEKRAEFQKACEGKGVSEVSKMAGEEWKKLSEQDREPYQKKYEAAKQQYDQDLATFLANGGTKEKGAAALRKDAMKLKEAKKASKDKDAPKRPAGGAYGQFLAEKREEIKKSLPAGHSITDVAKKAGEMWKSLPADGRQKFEEAYKTANEEYKRQKKIYSAQKVDLPEVLEGEEPPKPVVQETPPKQPAQKRERDVTSSGQSKRGRPKKTAGISDEVLEKARAAGHETKLLALATRPEIIAAGVSPEPLLKALEESGGSVHKAKKALLAGLNPASQASADANEAAHSETPR